MTRIVSTRYLTWLDEKCTMFQVDLTHYTPAKRKPQTGEIRTKQEEKKLPDRVRPVLSLTKGRHPGQAVLSY